MEPLVNNQPIAAVADDVLIVFKKQTRRELPGHGLKGTGKTTSLADVYISHPLQEIFMWVGN